MAKNLLGGQLAPSPPLQAPVPVDVSEWIVTLLFFRVFVVFFVMY